MIANDSTYLTPGRLLSWISICVILVETCLTACNCAPVWQEDAACEVCSEAEAVPKAKVYILTATGACHRPRLVRKGRLSVWHLLHTARPQCKNLSRLPVLPNRISWSKDHRPCSEQLCLADALHRDTSFKICRLCCECGYFPDITRVRSPMDICTDDEPMTYNPAQEQTPAKASGTCCQSLFGSHCFGFAWTCSLPCRHVSPVKQTRQGLCGCAAGTRHLSVFAISS